MSYEWNSLNVREKIMLVTTDILQLLDRLCEKTQPGGELDSVIESASESFEPLGELLQIKWEEGGKSINVQTLSQFILSGHSIITPEVTRLLGSSFKPAARNAEEIEGNKSSSQGSEREQSVSSTKIIDELLDSRDRRRRRDSVFEKVLSKHSPIKDLTQPGPSGSQTRREDVSVRERFLKQSVRGVSSPTSSGTLSEHHRGARQPREHSENLSQPGPSGVRTFSTQGAKGPGRNEGNENSSTSSQNELVNYVVSKRIELQTQSPEESQGNNRSSRSQREQTHLGLSETQTKRKDDLGREKFPKNIYRSVSPQRPSETSYTATHVKRQPRHHSEDSRRSGRGESSEGFRKSMLPKHSSVDQSEIIHSKRKKKSSDSKRTRESSSIYKSLTPYDADEWETDSDEYENDRRRSSTIY